MIEGTRIPNGEQVFAIYQGEFEDLPDEVRKKFEEVSALITKANAASALEKEAQAKYDELVATDDKSTLDDHHQDEDLRLQAIEKAETTVKKIMEVGNI